MRTRALVCAAVGLSLAAGALPGDSGKQRGDRVARLIRQLGDDEFARREAAGKELEAVGEPALEALRRAAAESKDPEIRRRAEQLCAAIRQRAARIDVKKVPPPKGATVLFDGKDLDGWAGRDGRADPAWALLDGGVMEARAADVRTRKTFAGAYRLHVEFRIPPSPANTPQGRGNSGVYVHGRYEVQILDSYGPQAKAPGAIHSAPAESCGAIFGQAAPRVNACKAPGVWQSYDIEFHPARYKEGRRVRDARMTVHHNGTLIHDKVEVPTDDTGMGLPGDPAEPAPVMLQYHGSPVQFRNLWLLPLAKR